VHLNVIGAWNYIFFGVALVLLGVVRANGAVIPPLIILAFALLVVRFPLALTLMPRVGPDAIWWSFPLSSFVALVLGALYYRFGRWRDMGSMMEHDPTQSSAHEQIGAGREPVLEPAREPTDARSRVRSRTARSPS
ncbi:MAG: MATE family efflux transporter, partial [Steroidobacteraceae bacterium]